MPSGLKATEVTVLEWPERVRKREPEEASQSLMELSQLAEARDLPSGLKATEVTGREWPTCRTTSGSPLAGRRTTLVPTPAARTISATKPRRLLVPIFMRTLAK